MESKKENLSEEYFKLLTARSFHKYFVDNLLQGKEYYISFKYENTNQVLIMFEFKGFMFKDILKDIPFAKYKNGTLGESGLITLNLDDFSDVVDREAEDKFLKEEQLNNQDYDKRLNEYENLLDKVQDSEAYLSIPFKVGRYYTFELDPSLKVKGLENLEREFRQEIEIEIIDRLRAILLPKIPQRVKSKLWNGRIRKSKQSFFEYNNFEKLDTKGGN